jgi:hypothetical protein
MAQRRVVVTNYRTPEQCDESRQHPDREYVIDYVTQGESEQDRPRCGTIDQATRIGMSGVELDVLDQELHVLVSVRLDDSDECPPTLRTCD